MEYGKGFVVKWHTTVSTRSLYNGEERVPCVFSKKHGEDSTVCFSSALGKIKYKNALNTLTARLMGSKPLLCVFRDTWQRHGRIKKRHHWRSPMTINAGSTPRREGTCRAYGSGEVRPVKTMSGSIDAGWQQERAAAGGRWQIWAAALLLLDPPGSGRAAVLFLLDPLGGGALAPGVAKRRAGGGKNERRVAVLLLLDPLVGGALAPARWRGSRS
jgi:hypothetical protein